MPTFLLLATAGICIFVGCVTSSQGRAMQRQIGHLHQRVASMEKQVGTNLPQILMQVQDDIGKLKGIIERATRNLGENAADFALQIDKLRTDLAIIEGRLEELSYRLDVLAKELEQARKEQEAKLERFQKLFGLDMPLDPSKIPDGKEAHWQKAQEVWSSKDYELARGLFREYAKRYPSDDLADDAQLNVGLIYIEEGRAAKALGELQRVVDAHPNTDRMDAVLYHMGEAFLMVQNCKDARTLFKSVINQFPSSPYKKKSGKKIQEILKAPKSVCPSI